MAPRAATTGTGKSVPGGIAVNLQDPLPIQPWNKPCRGSVRVPGSKSITNRALVLAALAEGTVTLTGALFSRDSSLLVDALKALGFQIRADSGNCSFTIQGESGRIPAPEAELFVGNAGTAARFLTALVCLHPSGRFHLDGDKEMHKRPMAGLIRALEETGARFQFHGQEDCFPFTVETKGLTGGTWSVDASASSQMLSALLMVAPYARKRVRLLHGSVRPAFVRMTVNMMRQCGAIVSDGDGTFHEVSPVLYRFPSSSYPVEPDATAASYFLTLPLVVGGGLSLQGLKADMLQGDVLYADVLRKVGASIICAPDSWTVSPKIRPQTEAVSFSFECFSDTFLTLAAYAPLLPFPVTISGIGHTRHQECDRIEAITTELSRAGFRAESGPDFVKLYPAGTSWTPPRRMVTLNTYRDHRVAMSLAVLGCRDMRGDGLPWMALVDPSCASKTFPGFYSELEKLYLISHDE